MKRYLGMVILLGWMHAGAALAAPPDHDELQARVMRLAAELRCVVCQNQSLADSNAELALDLRGQIAQQMLAGRSEAEIIDYLVQRYGEFILYRPTFSANNGLLWLGPGLLLGMGLWLYRRSARGSGLQMEMRS